jgi:NAD-dependent deacetylase
MLKAAHLQEIERFFDRSRRGQLIFLAVGTSGAVYPAAGLVHEAKARGAQTVLVNADLADNAGAFEHVLTGVSGQLLPGLFETDPRTPP